MRGCLKVRDSSLESRDSIEPLPAHGFGVSGVRVLKFGSSSLDIDRGFERPARIAREALEGCARIVIVTSALPGVTDELWALAGADEGTPSLIVSSLLATGEQSAVSLLGVALHKEGLDVGVSTLPPIRTVGPRLEAVPQRVLLGPLRRRLARNRVLVLPGFIGVHADDATSLLGRGGSDLTAMLVAAALDCDCRLIKNVDGVYESDPASGLGGRRFRTLTSARACRIGGRIVQERALEYARERNLMFSVGADLNGGTVIGAKTSVLYPEAYGDPEPCGEELQ